MSDVDRIVAFLTARYDETEAIARAANGPRWAPGDGDVSEGGLYALQGESSDGWSIAWFELGTANEAKDGDRQIPRWPKMKRHAHENSVHAAHHDPAAVLADIEAKRRIVRDATYWIVDARPVSPNARQFANDTLRILASAFASHPDYDPTWAL